MDITPYGSRNILKFLDMIVGLSPRPLGCKGKHGERKELDNSESDVIQAKITDAVQGEIVIQVAITEDVNEREQMCR